MARPYSYYRYQGADLALKAAVLAHGIAEGQVFVEGNKRTALAAMYAAIRANNYDLDASEDDRFRWMVSLSQGLTPERLAEELRERLRPINDPQRG